MSTAKFLPRKSGANGQLRYNEFQTRMQGPKAAQVPFNNATDPRLDLHSAAQDLVNRGWTTHLEVEVIDETFATWKPPAVDPDLKKYPVLIEKVCSFRIIAS